MTEWMGITSMKCNNIGYLLKEGFLGIFRHGFMSFAAVIVTVACLLIVAFLFACAAQFKMKGFYWAKQSLTGIVLVAAVKVCIWLLRKQRKQ